MSMLEVALDPATVIVAVDPGKVLKAWQGVNRLPTRGTSNGTPIPGDHDQAGPRANVP